MLSRPPPSRLGEGDTRQTALRELESPSSACRTGLARRSSNAIHRWSRCSARSLWVKAQFVSMAFLYAALSKSPTQLATGEVQPVIAHRLRYDFHLMAPYGGRGPARDLDTIAKWADGPGSSSCSIATPEDGRNGAYPSNRPARLDLPKMLLIPSRPERQSTVPTVATVCY